MSKADYEKLYIEAIEIIQVYPSGTIFLAKDPFECTYWKALGRGDKLGYGGFFKHKVILGQVPNVTYYEKADNNSAQYIQ